MMAKDTEDVSIDDQSQAKNSELSKEELKAQGGEQLPDREAMSLIDLNAAVPVNAAVAANVLSDGSTATADAEQQNDISQST
jgi:hypothetical protein